MTITQYNNKLCLSINDLTIKSLTPWFNKSTYLLQRFIWDQKNLVIKEVLTEICLIKKRERVNGGESKYVVVVGTR